MEIRTTRRKTLKELTLKDNFMFGAVMSDEAICKEFLEIVLKVPIRRVQISKEKSIIYNPEYRGVRLDVFASDEDNTRYNIEMQVARKPALGRRSRYYGSQIDMELLLSGEDYSQLPDVYVIFICDFDPFGLRKYCYTFENCCLEKDALTLRDGRRSIFLSTMGENETEVSRELICFLKFIQKGALEVGTEDDFTKKLSDSISSIKGNREMEERFMTIEEMIQDERAEAKSEGTIEGKIEEKTEGLLEILSSKGTIPSILKQKLLEEKDITVLKDYFSLAIKSASIDEFMEQMKK